MNVLPITLHAEVIDVADELADDAYSSPGQAVSVRLGEHEITRLTGPEVAWYGGSIDLAETVAGWLSRKLR
jgi:hypothetical protein